MIVNEKNIIKNKLTYVIWHDLRKYRTLVNTEIKTQALTTNII